jgi:hypothetical protein
MPLDFIGQRTSGDKVTNSTLEMMRGMGCRDPRVIAKTIACAFQLGRAKRRFASFPA